MSITFAIDRSARLVRAEVVGDFDTAGILATIHTAARAIGEPGYHILSDHRRIGEPATREQLLAAVETLQALSSLFAHARWAVVVSRPASYGMMRMFEVLAERVPLTVRTFWDVAAAERWVITGEDEPG